MASKSYEVSFRINGALSGQFASAMAAAQNALRSLGQAAGAVNAAMARSQGALTGYLQRLNQIGADSARYAQLKASITQNMAALQSQVAKTGVARKGYEEQRRSVEGMKGAYKDLTSARNRAKTAYDKETLQLKVLKQERARYKEEMRLERAKSPYAGQDRVIESIKEKQAANTAAIQAQAAKAKEAKGAYDLLSESVKKAKGELKTAEGKLRELGTGFSNSRSKVQELHNTLQRQKSALAQLKTSLNSAGFNTEHFIQSEMKLRSEIEATTRAIERQGQVANRLTAAQSRINTASSNLSDAQNAYDTVTDAVGTVTAPIKRAVETSITFEHAMSKVKALTQSGNIRAGNYSVVEKEMAALTAQAKELGATTQFTAIDAANAMGYLGLAGWKTNQILGTMPGLLNLASAAGEDLGRTSDIVSDNMTAMGVPAEQAGHFMDVYAYALTNSNARLSDFGETMKYAAPVAKVYGSTLEETAAMVMMMANAGIKGSMAGTSLRMGLLRLAGPPKTVTKAMKELGLSLSEAQAGALEAEAVRKGLGIDLNGAVTPGEKMTRVMMQLHEKTKNLSQDEKLAAFKGIFGVNAETGWLTMFDQGPEVFLKYVEGLRQADGYAKQVSETMLDDTQGAITKMESAIEGAYLAIGEAVSPAVRSVAESITPLISGFAQWAEANRGIVQGVVGLIAGLGAIATAAAGVAVAFAGWSVITAQIGMFRAGLAAVQAGMIGAEVASLGMAARMGAAFGILQARMLAIGTSMRAVTWGGLFAGLSGQIAAAGVAIRGFFATLTLGSIVSSVTAGLSSIGAAIMGVGRAAMAFAFSPIGAGLLALAAAAYVVYNNWSQIAPAFSGIGAAISSALSGASAAVSGLIAALAPIGSALASAFGNTGFTQTIIYSLIAVVNVAASVAVAIVNIFTGAVNTIKDLFSGLKEAFDAATDLDFGKMTDALSKMGSNIKKDWTSLEWYNPAEGTRQGVRAYQTEVMTDRMSSRAVQPISDAVMKVNADAGVRQIAVDIVNPLSNAIKVVNRNAGVQPQPITQPQPQPIAQPIAQPQPQPQPQPITQPQPQPIAQPIAQPEQQSQPIDTTAIQTAIQQAGQSIQQFPQMLQPVQESLTQFPQMLQPVQESLTQFPQMLQPVQESLTQFPQMLQPMTAAFTEITTAISGITAAFTEFTAAIAASGAAFTEHNAQVQASSAALTALAAAIAATLGAIAGFTGALMGAVGGISALGSAAGGAAGSVSSLGSAAASAASALVAAAATAASAAASAASAAASAGAAKNYKGGIYNKGAFLTWFAERSPEAAIPLDKSERAISLWTQAGQILGVLPSEGNINVESPRKDTTYNNIQKVQREKEARARQVYEKVISGRRQENEVAGDTTLTRISTTIQKVSEVQRKVQDLQAIQFDELGNIVGYEGSAGNVITKYDNEKIKHVKQEAQVKEYRERTEAAARKVVEATRQIEKVESRSIAVKERLNAVMEKVREYRERSRYEERDGVKVYERRESEVTPRILTEGQRYRSEDVSKERTLERIKNSKSYKAIARVQNEKNRQSTSILNRGELNTQIKTDITGGILGRLFGNGQPIDYTGIKTETIPKLNKMSPIDLTGIKTETIPNPNKMPSIDYTGIKTETIPNPNKMPSIDYTGIKTETIPQGSSDLIERITAGLGGILPQSTSNIIENITTGLSGLIPQGSSNLIENITTGLTNIISGKMNILERLNEVESQEENKRYEAGTFQPTFNISVTVQGGDGKVIGEEIAQSARESFAKEYERYMHEKVRRGFV